MDEANALLLYTPTQYGDYSIYDPASAITSTVNATKSLPAAIKDYSPLDVAPKEQDCDDASNSQGTKYKNSDLPDLML